MNKSMPIKASDRKTSELEIPFTLLGAQSMWGHQTCCHQASRPGDNQILIKIGLAQSVSAHRQVCVQPLHFYLCLFRFFCTRVGFACNYFKMRNFFVEHLEPRWWGSNTITAKLQFVGACCSWWLLLAGLRFLFSVGWCQMLFVVVRSPGQTKCMRK